MSKKRSSKRRPSRPPTPKPSHEGHYISDAAWIASRAGARAGRGFRFQDVVGAHLLVSMWRGERLPGRLVPEGWDDLVLELDQSSHYIQVKSRQPHLDPFQDADLASFLADGWERHAARLAESGTEFVLILERGTKHFGPGEHLAKGISDDDRLRSLLTKRVGTDRADEILGRSQVWVWPDPERDAIDRLAERLALPEGACVPHVHALRSAVGEAADKNASAPKPGHGISITNVAQIVDRVSGLLDRDGLLEAVAQGLCEVVDQQTSDNDQDFYLGVDATPAHVAAGLVITRPEALALVSDALRNRGIALLAGPSGSGKSALMWSAAYENRQCRWYRVRRLGSDDDVTALIRLAKALMPSARSPVGFVVDNVGQPGSESWDSLVRELALIPGTYLLGAAREEDLFLVSTLPRVAVIRLAMNDELATAIYNELRSRNQTSWSHWREPYELSDGLLLEYVHILSAGKRLEEVVGDQIRARRRENRDLELRILSVAGTAAAWGAGISLDPLVGLLGDSEAMIAAALDRLVGEHLLQLAPEGRVKGLHRVRSRAIFNSLHNRPPPTESQSIMKVIEVLDISQIQSFLVGCLADSPHLIEAILSAVAARLEESRDASLSVVALQAFRIVEFVGVAREWLAIMEQEGVPAVMRSLGGSFVVAGLDLGSMEGLLDPRLLGAVRTMMLKPTDRLTLRERLLSVLPEAWMVRCLTSQRDLRLVAQLLAVLDGMGGQHPELRILAGLEGSPLEEALAKAEVRDVGLVIAAARGVSVETARRLTLSAGGPDAILVALENSTPWCRGIQVGEHKDGLLDGHRVEDLADDAVVARAEYRYISDELSVEIHEATVDLAHMIVACHPDIELVHVVALDAREKPHGFGELEVANKWLRRDGLHAPHAIAWNRARIRTFETMVASVSHTDRVASELDLIRRTKKLMETIARIRITGQGGSRAVLSRLGEERQALITAVDDLPPPPVESTADLGPLDPGTSSTPDHVHGLLRTCLVNAISAMLDENRLRRVASLLADASNKHLDEALAPDRWQILGFDQPPEEVRAFAEIVDDLAAVASEIAFGDSSERALRMAARAAHGSALGAAATRARERGRKRFEDGVNHLVKVIEERGATAEVFTRQAVRPAGVTWPPLDTHVAVTIERLDKWAELTGELLGARAKLSGVHSVWATPVREGVAIPFLSVAVHPTKIFPAPDAWETWQMQDRAVLSSGACFVFREAIGHAAALSSAAALSGGVRQGEEKNIVERLVADFNSALKEFAELANGRPDDPLLAEAAGVMQSLANQIQEEFDSPDSSGEMAASLLDTLEGIETPVNATIAGTSFLLAEWDINAEGAIRWYEEL